MSTDQRLGLTYVRSALRAALAELRPPLERVLSGEEHRRTPGAAKNVQTDKAQTLVDQATKNLQILGSNWSAPVKRLWKAASGRREERLIVSLGTPRAYRKRSEPYAFAAALAAAVGCVASLVEQVNAASIATWQDAKHKAGRETAEEVRG